MLCFLRANDHGLGPAGLRNALSGQGPMPTRSHCDIVVAANVGGDRTLYLIGGNVLNAVVMRKLPLDRNGRLLPEATGSAMASPPDAGRADSGTPAGAATPAPAGAPVSGGTAAGDESEESGMPIDGAACRPGYPAACSFNRRDWAVLLKLKPQAQLGGPVPVAVPAPALPAPSAPPAAERAAPASTP